jgi:F5/8 type C domain-containing protein
MLKRSVFVGTLLSAATAMIAGCGGSEPQLGTSTYESLPDQQRQALTASSVPISGVVASADDGNVAANVLDGNLSTRWSCNGVGCWIRADLGAQTTVNSLGVAWYSGDARTNNFTVSVSNDDVSYAQVFSGTSSGTTLQIESYTLAASQARYVKLTVNGNSVNSWASVTELQVNSGATSASTSTSTTPTTTPSGPIY